MVRFDMPLNDQLTANEIRRNQWLERVKPTQADALEEASLLEETNPAERRCWQRKTQAKSLSEKIKDANESLREVLTKNVAYVGDIRSRHVGAESSIVIRPADDIYPSFLSTEYVKRHWSFLWRRGFLMLPAGAGLAMYITLAGGGKIEALNDLKEASAAATNFPINVFSLYSLCLSTTDPIGFANLIKALLLGAAALIPSVYLNAKKIGDGAAAGQALLNLPQNSFSALGLLPQMPSVNYLGKYYFKRPYYVLRHAIYFKQSAVANDEEKSLVSSISSVEVKRHELVVDMQHEKAHVKAGKIFANTIRKVVYQKTSLPWSTALSSCLNFYTCKVTGENSESRIEGTYNELHSVFGLDNVADSQKPSLRASSLGPIAQVLHYSVGNDLHSRPESPALKVFDIIYLCYILFSRIGSIGTSYFAAQDMTDYTLLNVLLGVIFALFTAIVSIGLAAIGYSSFYNIIKNINSLSAHYLPILFPFLMVAFSILALFSGSSAGAAAENFFGEACVPDPYKTIFEYASFNASSFVNIAVALKGIASILESFIAETASSPKAREVAQIKIKMLSVADIFQKGSAAEIALAIKDFTTEEKIVCHDLLEKAGMENEEREKVLPSLNVLISRSTIFSSATESSNAPAAKGYGTFQSLTK